MNPARMFGALADDTRLRMLRLLLEKDSLCVCEVMEALRISQTRASRNLAILRDAGFLADKRVGTWMYYSVNDGADVRRWSPVLKLIRSDPGIPVGRARRRQRCE